MWKLECRKSKFEKRAEKSKKGKQKAFENKIYKQEVCAQPPESKIKFNTSDSNKNLQLKPETSPGTAPAGTSPRTSLRPGTPIPFSPGTSPQFASSEPSPTTPSRTQPCTTPDATSGPSVTPTVSRKLKPRPQPPDKLPLPPNVPSTRACSPHTPPGTPPCRGSPPLAITTGTCSTDSTRPEDSTSTSSSTLPITEEYITGINQIDLGPRVNDLSKL